MPKIEKNEKKIAWVASIFIATALILFGYIMFWGTIVFDELVFFAVVIGVIPPTILDYVDYQWRRDVDEQMPDLFRSIVQAQETGMPLPQALEEVSKRDYGPLTNELKKMTAQMSWGRTFEEALLTLQERVDTLLMRRTVPMITEAARSGGRVEEIFDPLGKFIQTTLLLNEERRNQTRPYTAIIYVAFFVFLFTIIMLFRSFFFFFFASIEELPILSSAIMKPEEIQRMFFHMTAIQAFFGGLVAGKMGKGIISAGLKHSLILMLCGYMGLRLFLWG
ncbi:hypothetical protein GTO27_09760 [Candidatus Bathyarchaeota archaeon]|nr:hypothetical protein [Candidatus Bathyarchaeota archaeon]